MIQRKNRERKPSRIQIDRLITALKPTLKCSDKHCTHHIQRIPCLQLFSIDMRVRAFARKYTSDYVWAAVVRTLKMFAKFFPVLRLCCSTHGRLLWSRIHFRPTKIVEYYLLDHKSHTLSIFAPTEFTLGERRIFNHWFSRAGREREKNNNNKTIKTNRGVTLVIPSNSNVSEFHYLSAVLTFAAVPMNVADFFSPSGSIFGAISDGLSVRMCVYMSDTCLTAKCHYKFYRNIWHVRYSNTIQIRWKTVNINL